MLLSSTSSMKLSSQTLTVKTPKLHPAQSEIDRNSRRFNVLCCGRRFGKDVYLERRVVRELLKNRKPVGWFAPTYRMLLENWRMMRNILAPVTARANDSEHRIDLITGNALEMWSLDNPDSARGRKYGHVVINEAALVKGLWDAWNMVIRPTLADYRGGADIASTPRGLNGFYELWKMSGDDWARFRYRTDDNPYISRGEIAMMRASLPERVIRQELDAEFLEDGAFFQGIDKVAIIEAPDPPEAHAGHYLVGGLDWAMSEDYTVLTIGCRNCNRVVYWWRDNRVEYTWQRARIVEECRRYGVRSLLPERNSIGQPNIEMLIRDGLPIMRGDDRNYGFLMTATTKPALIQSLAAALESGNFLVPANYADELRSYQVEVLSSGHHRFSAPSGYHDDRVISLALCWHAMCSYLSNLISFVG